MRNKVLPIHYMQYGNSWKYKPLEVSYGDALIVLLSMLLSWHTRSRVITMLCMHLVELVQSCRAGHAGWQASQQLVQSRMNQVCQEERCPP